MRQRQIGKTGGKKQMLDIPPRRINVLDAVQIKRLAGAGVRKTKP